MPYTYLMDSVKDIEAAVSKLSREELSSFRTWFADFDGEASTKGNALTCEAFFNKRTSHCIKK